MPDTLQDHRAAEALVKRFEARAAASVAKFRSDKTAAHEFLVKVEARVGGSTPATRKAGKSKSAKRKRDLTAA